MKFAITVVMLALAIVGAQSSVVPWLYGGHHHAPIIAAHHGPVLAHHGAILGHHGAAVAIHPVGGISLSQGPAWGHHHGVAVAHHVPVAHAAHAAVAVAHHVPAHAVVAAAHHHDIHHDIHHGIHHDAHYVAKTRGALHSAPLAGHIASVSSVNVAPAPGTH